MLRLKRQKSGDVNSEDSGDDEDLTFLTSVNKNGFNHEFSGIHVEYMYYFYFMTLNNSFYLVTLPHFLFSLIQSFSVS